MAGPPVTRRVLAVLVAVAVLASGCGGPEKKPGASSGKRLVGTFKLTAGNCTATGAEGTYFRMINVGGTIEKGPYFGNPDSPCTDKSFNVQAPGTDGGLVSGTYQAGPKPPFDGGGNALAGRIVKPGRFTAIRFAISTGPSDPQTKKQVAAPEIYVEDGKLSGQVSAWSAAWNNLYFNQGSPKPDGSSPGLTTPLTGTYDDKTGAFVITWASQVVGGPFNGFAGYWHLTGTFEAGS